MFWCPTSELQSSHFSIYNLTFLIKRVKQIKEEKSRLPVDVHGSKTSVLKLPIYGDHQRGLFIKCMLFGVLFSHYRTAKKRTRWPQNSWNTTDLKIICLFLSSFYIYNFHLYFTVPWYFVTRRRNYSISCFQIAFAHSEIFPKNTPRN